MRLITTIGLVCFIGGAVVMLAGLHLGMPGEMPPPKPLGMWDRVSFVGLLFCVGGTVSLCVSALAGSSTATQERPGTSDLHYCRIIAALLDTWSTPQMMPPELMRDAEVARDTWNTHGRCDACGQELGRRHTTQET